MGIIICMCKYASTVTCKEGVCTRYRKLDPEVCINNPNWPFSQDHFDNEPFDDKRRDNE